MGRPKGGTNKNWTKNEKEKRIKEALDNGIRNTAKKIYDIKWNDMQFD